MLGLAQMPVDPARGLVSCMGYPEECEASALAKFTLMVAGQADIKMDERGNIESATPGPAPDDVPPPIDLCTSCVAVLKSEMVTKVGSDNVFDIEGSDQDEMLN